MSDSTTTDQSTTDQSTTDQSTTDPSQARKRLLFLFSDTGGAHRSVASAIAEAVEAEYPGRFSCQLVDYLREYCPWPFSKAPEIFSKLAAHPASWAVPFNLANSALVSRMLVSLCYLYVQRGLKRLMADNPSDLVVSTHPLVNRASVRAMGRRRVPFVTMCTDIITAHAMWFHEDTDLIIVPTQEAARLGVKYGARADHIRVIGLPVSGKFSRHLDDPTRWREQHGWDPSLPAALLIGGGDGFGPVEEMARAINDARLPLQLVVVCGRNERLKAGVEAIDWRIPAHIYGFTTELPAMMSAADALLTKAGAVTISEGLVSGLPLIVYSKLPGQEEGNIPYVEQAGAGVWAPKPDQVVATLRKWLDDPSALQAAAEASLALAKPDAARDIARELAALVGVTD
ncbi:MAG: hypothetical protein LBR32_01285 [Propionibacteriaceae bacterium]|nr:hypothetical protein [Propionibacteriaceae bacterium]